MVGNTHAQHTTTPLFFLCAGLTGTYFYLYTYGGPVSIVWGWLLVSTANLLLGLVLAEICSSYPTSGGVYFWAHRLAGESDATCMACLQGQPACVEHHQQQLAGVVSVC